jgi:hypothetical protein
MVLVADRMVFSAVDEVLVESLGDEVVLVGVRGEQAEGAGLDLQFGGITPDRVVTEPQLVG